MSLSGLVSLTLQATGQPVPVPAPSHTTPKHATTGIKAIPSAVFGRILSFLPAQQITTCLHHVCKDWRKLPLINDGCLDLSGLPNLSDSDLKTILDKASGIRISSINLSNCEKITDASLAHLVTLTSLSSLNLNKCPNITDAGLAHLSKLTLLSSLSLDWCENITDAGLVHLSELTLLRSLCLNGCENITDAGLAHLSKLTLLRSLDLHWCDKITDDGLAHLSKLTLLSSLNLAWCSNITDAGLAHLSEFTLLSSLDLTGCYDITDDGLAHLSKLTLLSSLDLTECRNITDAGLAHVSKLTLLSSLDLRRCYDITDAGLAYLSKLTLLSSLNLNGCRNITDAGLAYLSELTLLSSLDLNGYKQITDDGLEHLSKLTLLRSLDIGECQNITDAGLAHLVTLTLLRSLYLNGCRNITNAGLAHLSKLTLLSLLDLRECRNITNADLAHLSKLTLLSSLDLRGCDKITIAGLAHLVTLTLLSSQATAVPAGPQNLIAAVSSMSPATLTIDAFKEAVEKHTNLFSKDKSVAGLAATAEAMRLELAKTKGSQVTTAVAELNKPATIDAAKAAKVASFEASINTLQAELTALRDSSKDGSLHKLWGDLQAKEKELQNAEFGLDQVAVTLTSVASLSTITLQVVALKRASEEFTAAKAAFAKANDRHIEIAGSLECSSNDSTGKNRFGLIPTLVAQKTDVDRIVAEETRTRCEFLIMCASTAPQPGFTTALGY